MADVFDTFVFDHLPPPPRRVLEVGCGREGGLVGALAARGYVALGVDPQAPPGDRFIRATFQAADERLAPGRWDAVVAGRVLHHVHPLEESLEVLASLAPLLFVDEFAWDLIDPAAREWYEEQHRSLGGAGPSDLGEWRRRWADLHPHGRLLEALRARYRESTLEWVPYFHRWLDVDGAEELERAAIAAGRIPAIGYRWAGAARSTTRSSAASR